MLWQLPNKSTCDECWAERGPLCLPSPLVRISVYFPRPLSSRSSLAGSTAGEAVHDPKRSRVAWSYVPKIARLDHNSQALGAGGIGSGG